jgi:hypothetical protein
MCLFTCLTDEMQSTLCALYSVTELTEPALEGTDNRGVLSFLHGVQNMRALTLAIGSSLLLSACVLPTWNKPDGTRQEFAQDKYQCLQGAQQQQGSAMVNGSSGYANQGSVTNPYLFSSCMNAHGWYLSASR